MPATSLPPLRVGLVLSSLLVSAAGQAACGATPDDLAFFETKIRPVLAAHCYQCHSAEALRAGKLKAGLLVDTRGGMAKGGESGAAVVPGDRKGSLILAALKHDGFEMPPAGKLPDPVIADFERWIDMGAPDPREEPPAAVEERTIDVAAGRRHWSYRRLTPVSPPTPADVAWPRNDIDRFIRVAQEQAGITPAAEAAKAVLARRVSFDLTGLPPAPEELEAFLDDPAADAYERLVDRLLASPRFGERWARHWLDAVRFAESGGYEFDGDRPGAHHYRDWVVRALNADLPYDEFLRLQVAGDLIKPGDYDATSATGFLVAGPYPGQVTAKTVEPIRYDQLDDMLSTLGSGVLGMTIGCARCHDHKYDAIAHRDYYAMLACLGKAVQRDTDIDLDPAGSRAKREAWQAERAPVAAAEAAFRSDELPGRVARWLATDAPAQLAPAPWMVLDPQTLKAAKATLAKDASGIVTASGKLEANENYTLTFRTRSRDLSAIRIEPLASGTAGPGTGKDGAFRLSTVKVTAAPAVPAPDRKNVQAVLKAVAATAQEPGFELEKAVDAAPDTGWSVGGPPGRDHAAVIAFDRPIGYDGGTVLTIELRFEANSNGLARFRIAAATDPAADIAAPAAAQAPRELALTVDAADAAGTGLGAEPVSAEIAGWFAAVDDRTREIRDSLAAVDAREPRPNLIKVYAATNGAWVISGNSQGVTSGSQDVFVLGRGEVGRKKGKATPGFVLATVAADEAEGALFSGPDKAPLPDSRLGLAEFITDVPRGAGPLAARVIVNRLWHHHFGRGIVATPNDLGTQGEPPSHPELLEWLANRLVENHWSLKSIHRLIVTSAAYRQSAAAAAENGAAGDAGRTRDPDNRLLWHRRPTRLEGEAIRDALLASSGMLDPTMHGRAGRDAASRRRSIYLEVKRSEPIGFLQVFDQPEAVQPVGARGVATVPTQALAMLNSPLVRSAAESLAKKCREGAGQPASGATGDAAVDRAFVAVLSRHPTPAERERFTAFLAAREAAAGGDAGRRQQALVDACHLLYCTNEFIYVD